MRAIEERKELDELLAELDEAIVRRDAYEVYLITTQMRKVGRAIREKETAPYCETDEPVAAAQ